MFHNIPGEKNKIADCLSRLTRRIREAEHFVLSDPILGNYAKINKIAYKSKVETEDPWVEKLAIAAMSDPEYVTMIAHIENGTDLNDIPKDSELANMRSNWKDLSMITIKGGKTLILKNNVEIMIPKAERINILNIAHQTN